MHPKEWCNATALDSVPIGMCSILDRVTGCHDSRITRIAICVFLVWQSPRHLLASHYVHTMHCTILLAQNLSSIINTLKPNGPYSGHTAPLTSKRCILYIYSTNMGTEYFKRGIYSPFLSSSKCSLFHNSNVFGSCIIHILYTGCAKIK